MVESQEPSPKVDEKRDELEGRLTELRTDLTRLVERIDVNVARPLAPDAVAAAPDVPEQLRQADELVLAIDEEIARVDLLLARIAAREREIRIRGFAGVGEPYRSAEFTLYAREVPTDESGTRVKYFFADEPPLNAVPVPLPEGYEVEIDPKTSKRSLRRPRK
jgi:hypothetical protein